MMSSAGTSRASRSNKDKTVKIQQPQNVKSEGPPKNQPTPEQMRLAQMITDKNDIEDPVLQAKVKQVMEYAGRSADVAIVALHDCDHDPNRAINMLLEGEDDQGEWQATGKRRKGKTQPPIQKSADSLPNSPSDVREKSRDREEYVARDSGPPRDRDRRGRQPPRLARKNREREENERNAQRNRGGDEEGESRERSYERGRGRGRGQMNSAGRGRGRGGRSYRSNRYDKGPQIDTWTNETAENAEKENTSWGEVSEDWTADEWTGSLEETKVFTASHAADAASKGFSSAVGDNDAKMFSTPSLTVENQVFTSSMSLDNSNQPALSDTTNTLQNSIGQNSIGQSSITQSSMGQNSSIGQSTHSLGQRLDLGLLLQKPTETQQPTSQQQSQFMSQFSKQATESIKNAMGVTTQSQQQSQFMSQFSKEATESIKNMMGVNSQSQLQSEYMNQYSKDATESIKSAMGIGTTSSSHQGSTVANQQVRPSVTPQAQPQQTQQPMQPPQPQQQASQQVTQQQQPQQQQSMSQRPKPQRSKLPPPSKIPASAVEMPGHISSFQLDVQFGNWDFAPSESSEFSFGSVANDVTSSYGSTAVSTTTTTSPPTNHLAQVTKTTTETTSSMSSVMSPASMASVSSSSKPSMTNLDSITQNADHSPRPNVFQNSSSPATTPNKDYSQSRLEQSRKVSPPEPIPFPSDRKTSPHYSSQRSGHSTGSMSSQSKQSTSPSMTFSQSSYSSNYQSPNYQSNAKSPPSGYSHNSNSLSGSGNLASVQSGLQTHMSSSNNQYGHQGHSSYQSASSFQSQNAFSNQNQNSLYQSSSQPSSYNNQTASSYQNQNSSGYQNQTGSSYPSQSSSYHSRDSQSNSSSYQPSASQSGSPYQSSGSQSGNSSYQRDNQQSQSGYGSHQSYGSSSHQNSLQSSSISTNKLSDSLGKMSVKESPLDSHQSSSQHPYDHSSTSTSSTSITTTTPSSSLGGGNVAVSSGLALASTTNMTAATTIASTTKSTLPITSKAPPNLPPGVPPLFGHNYMVQPGMPFAAFSLAQQPTMYSYEDLQLLQQRLPLPGYYDMQFQPPTTLTGRDQGTLASVPYTGADGKLGRMDAQSPVQAQTSQQGQNQSGHQQAYINPTIPPGYYNYYPGGMLPSGYSYTPTMFPVPSVTNAAHGGTTANAQFQKPGAYGSHAYNTGYDELSSQTQDFTKYGGASQSQSKGSAGSVSSAATDLAGTTYGKTHTQSFDKTGFHAGTPPPFNIPLPTGTQAGPMGAPTAAYGGPYMPMMPHQAHSQMLHPHLQQDSTGGSSRGSQQSSSQPKPGATKPYSSGYWGAN